MIKQIRLINCQSWEDSIINFSLDTVNVICARNNTGKSVLFKMLKVLGCPKYFKKKKLRKLIRWGADKATMYLLFDDGSIGSVNVYPTRVIYGYRRVGEESFIMTEEPLPEMLQKAGIISDVDGAFIANIIDTEQDMLLVDSDLSKNFDLMKLLVYNEDLGNIKERSEEILNVFKTEQMKLEVEAEKVGKLLSTIEYIDLDKLEDEIKVQHLLHDSLYALVESYKKLEHANSFTVQMMDYDFMLESCAVLTALEQSGLDVLGVQSYKDFSMELEVLEVLESINTNELEVRETAIDELALRALEGLESFSVADLEVVSAPVDFRFLEVLEAFESGMPALKCSWSTGVFEEYALFLDALFNLENSQDLLSVVQDKLDIAKCAESEYSGLKDKFESSGSKHKCSIYGEVLFDGKKCIPYS